MRSVDLKFDAQAVISRLSRKRLMEMEEAGRTIKDCYRALQKADDNVVGVNTSGAFGHRTQKSLAFAYVAPDLSEVGTKIEVEVLEERRSATVLESTPVYDPSNDRIRA